MIPSEDPQKNLIKDRLSAINARIEAVRLQSLAAAKEVSLIAVSKGQGEDKIRKAIAAGHKSFGENRVQETQTKWRVLREAHADLALHLIGPLQTNKVKDALALFDMIHTLDRPKLADVIAKEWNNTSRTQSFFVEVNTGEESQKAGVSPKDAGAFIAYCKDELRLPVTGLMCIPPAADNPAPHFALLNTLAKEHGLSNLSMGMSADYETAVRLGATHVRIGTAIFGERH